MFRYTDRILPKPIEGTSTQIFVPNPALRIDPFRIPWVRGVTLSAPMQECININEPTTQLIGDLPNNSVIFYIADGRELEVYVKLKSGVTQKHSMNLALHFIDQTSKESITRTVADFVRTLETRPQIGILNVVFGHDPNLPTLYLYDNESLLAYFSWNNIQRLEEQFIVTGQLDIAIIDRCLDDMQCSLEGIARHIGREVSVTPEQEVQAIRMIIFRLKHLRSNPSDVDAFILKREKAVDKKGNEIPSREDGFQLFVSSYRDLDRYNTVREVIATNYFNEYPKHSCQRGCSP